MGSITVVLNKWNGKHFQSYSVKCDICKKVGHTIIFRTKMGTLRACSKCLTDGQTLLGEAILQEATK